MLWTGVVQRGTGAIPTTSGMEPWVSQSEAGSGITWSGAACHVRCRGGLEQPGMVSLGCPRGLESPNRKACNPTKGCPSPPVKLRGCRGARLHWMRNSQAIVPLVGKERVTLKRAATPQRVGFTLAPWASWPWRHTELCACLARLSGIRATGPCAPSPME